MLKFFKELPQRIMVFFMVLILGGFVGLPLFVMGVFMAIMVYFVGLVSCFNPRMEVSYKDGKVEIKQNKS